MNNCLLLKRNYISTHEEMPDYDRGSFASTGKVHVINAFSSIGLR